tara:strand:+ start:556 stop:1068 length:513 start_codon:yes stop_codon:yes gene_type:complete
MSKQLFLVRHAKSDWSVSLPDFERPLNSRGERQSLQIGEWMQTNKLIPDCIISSPATRARDTIMNICTGLDFDPHQICWQAELYHASWKTLLNAALKKLENHNTVMLVAHNPGLDELVERLCPAQELPVENDAKLMTTASFAQFELADNLHEHTYQSGHLIQLIRPVDII